VRYLQIELDWRRLIMSAMLPIATKFCNAAKCRDVPVAELPCALGPSTLTMLRIGWLTS